MKTILLKSSYPKESHLSQYLIVVHSYLFVQVLVYQVESVKCTRSLPRVSSLTKGVPVCRSNVVSFQILTQRTKDQVVTLPFLTPSPSEHGVVVDEEMRLKVSEPGTIGQNKSRLTIDGLGTDFVQWLSLSSTATMQRVSSKTILSSPTPYSSYVTTIPCSLRKIKQEGQTSQKERRAEFSSRNLLFWMEKRQCMCVSIVGVTIESFEEH